MISTTKNNYGPHHEIGAALRYLARTEVRHDSNAAPSILVEEVRPHESRLYVAKASHGWGVLGRALSLLLPGQIWPGEASLTWVNGQNIVWVADPALLQGVEQARCILHEVTKEPAEKLPWTVSSCARRLLKWLDLRELRHKPAEILRRDVAWYYVHCEPCTLEKAYYWDVSSCYYSILARMPNPLPSLDPMKGNVAFPVLKREELDRWRKLLAAVAPHKQLRNSLCGLMAAGQGSYYSRGRVIEGKWQAGPLRPAALLAVRSAYELTAMAAKESRAKYAYTDCVISESAESPPEAWEKAGLSVRLKAEGKTEICHLTSVMCGDHKTKWYTRGSRAKIPSVSCRVWGINWSHWLREV